MSAKMDGVHTRTPSQLEQKINFGKSFAEVMGIATDARSAADEAKEAVETLDSDLTAEEVYNRLTNNGRLQGLYRDDKGNLFVNAEYIYALEKLFAKDINMSGKFVHTAKVFLEPDQEVINTIQKHLLGTEIIPIYNFPLYDFNNDGKISIVDLGKAQKALLGVDSLSDWSGAVKTDVTLTIDMSNPDKIVRIQGTNMWGRQVDKYIGVNFTNIRQEGLADYIVEEGAGYRKWASGKAECWGKWTIYTAIDSVTNGFYFSPNVFEKQDYPFQFADVPVEVVNYSAPGTHMGWIYTQSGNSATQTGKYNIMRWSAAVTEADVTLNYYAIGSWK